MQSLLKKISYIGLLFVVLGLADSIYLTIAHYTTTAVLACPESKFINCARVTTSPYSEIHGIPIVIFGLIFFVVMGVLYLPKSWQSKNKHLIYFRMALSTIGLMSVFYLVYVELYKLNTICLYCTGVHIITFVLFIVTLIGTTNVIQSKQDHQETTNK